MSVVVVLVVFIVPLFVRMGRRCSVVGCSSSVGLHWFPQDTKIKHQWLRVIGLGENTELPAHAGVCKQHFARDSFANILEFELGFAKRLLLKSEAVPTLALPRLVHRPLLPRKQEEVLPQSVLKVFREVACQTEPLVRPASTKRKRCDVSASDPSPHLNDRVSTANCTSTPIGVPPHKDKKYIVHEEQLLGLFRRCPVCTSCCIVDTMTIGTLLQVKQHCTRCEYYRQWSSQPMVNSIPAGNLQLCAAVLFTGSSFVQISKFLGAFNIQGLSEQIFHKHQDMFLIPTISWQWKLEQDELIKEALQSGSVTLGGDMRAESTGHSAKYSSCTMMNLKNNKVIDIQLVQSNEVGNSTRLEKEGFVRSLKLLEERGVKVQAMVTDQHTGVQKFLKEEKKEIAHYLDPWHMGKGIEKKIDELSKRRTTQDVGHWRKSIVNHLCWSAATSSSGHEAVAKWSSVANHIQNIHTHNNALFPCCLHEPFVGEEARPWLKPSTAACEKLNAILLAPHFVKDVEKISPQYHISTLEAFHSLNKSVGFSFKGMLARLQIAALHHNENATGTRAAAGDLRHAIVRKRGKYTVRAPKTKPTSFYIDKLMALLFESVVKDARPYQEHFDKVLKCNSYINM